MRIFLRLFARFKHYVARHWPRLYARLARRKSLVKFLMSGPIAGILDLGLLYILHGLFQVPVLWATTIAYIFSFGVSFYLQKFWTFCNYNRKHVHYQLLMYFFLAIINLNINGYLMYILINNYSVWYLFAQLGVSITIGLESYVIYKFVIFRKRHGDSCGPYKL